MQFAAVHLHVYGLQFVTADGADGPALIDHGQAQKTPEVLPEEYFADFVDGVGGGKRGEPNQQGFHSVTGGATTTGR
jgi:hypothetical protein